MDEPPRHGEGDHRAGDGGAASATSADAAPPPLAADERSPSPGRGGDTGRLLGIARHDRPRGAMQTVDAVAVGLATGIAGDFRGALKPGRNKRQVTLMTADAWAATLRELGARVPWEQRRVNLLAEGLAIEGITGARLVFSGGVVLEVTGECDPCSRMEEVAPGLRAALTPHWRGGVTTRVIAEGYLAIGDGIRIER